MTDVRFRLTEDRERLGALVAVCESFASAYFNSLDASPPPEYALALARAALAALEVEGSTADYRVWFEEAAMFADNPAVAAVLRALIRHTRLALLFTLVFGVGLLAHSLAAWKAERFIYYLLPAYFALWGLAAAEAFPWLWERLAGASRTLLATLPAKLPGWAAGAALAAAVAFAISVVPAYTQARQILRHGDAWSPPPGHLGERYRGHPDWAEAAPRLAPLADSVQVVIGQPDMKVIYYLGDVDYVLYASYLVDITRVVGMYDMQEEFTVWPKVGRPLVSRPESVELIMQCHETGLIVAEQHVWGWEGGVPAETADFIERHTRAVELAGNPRILAFRWQTPEPERSERCARIQEARREAAIRPAAGSAP